MAKKNNGTAVNEEPKNPLEAGDEMPEDFFAIQDNRLMYKPEECGERPIRGVMLGTMTMSPSKENLRENPNAKPWTALVVKLTAPCPVIAEDGVSIVEAKSGDEIIVGGADMAALYQPANHPTSAFEVWLKPMGETKLKSGRKMWRYTKAVSPRPLNRVANDLHFFGKQTAVPQLTEGQIAANAAADQSLFGN